MVVLSATHERSVIWVVVLSATHERSVVWVRLLSATHERSKVKEGKDAMMMIQCLQLTSVTHPSGWLGSESTKCFTCGKQPR